MSPVKVLGAPGSPESVWGQPSAAPSLPSWGLVTHVGVGEGPWEHFVESLPHGLRE